MPTLTNYLPLVLALNTIVIGAITTYVAIQQWKTNNLKVKMELYEKRLEVYKVLMQFIGRVIGTGEAPIEASIEYVQKTNDGYFLFDDEIGQYFQEVYKKGVDLGAYQKIMSDPNMNPANRDTLPKKIEELQKWFIAESERPQKRFVKFLRLK